MATSKKPVRKKPHPTTGDLEEQMTMQQDLQRTDAYVKALMENALDGIVVLNRDGTVRYQSPFMERVLGREQGERGGKSAFEFIHPDDLPKASNLFAELQQSPGATMFEEIRVLHQDGSVRTIEIVGQNLLDSPEVAGIVANLRDITERKKMEEELRRLVWAIESASDGVGISDVTGMSIYHNKAFVELLGYTVDELNAAGGPPAIFTDPDVLREMFDTIMKGSSCSGEVEMKTRTGRDLVVFLRADSVKDDDGRTIGLVGIHTDITERKRVEEALRKTNELYHLITNNITDVIWTTDMNLKFTYTSPSVTRIRGYSVEEAISLSLQETLTPASFDLAMKVYEEEMAIEKMEQKDLNRSRCIQVEEYCKDGSTIWIDIEMTFIRDSDGQAIGILGVARDITERKKAEEALLIKDNAIEKSLTAIAITDIEGTITYVNEACLDLWRIAKKEDVVGQSFWALLQLDADTANMVALSMIEHGQWKGELTFSRRNGEQIDVQVLAAMVYDTHGEAIQTITSFIDVTERKRMEQQLLLSGRLASVGELAAGVAHELNNPLAAVQAFAQFLADREDLDETAKSDVQTIYKEAQRATRITSNLLSFARKHNPERSLISINEVIEKSLELHIYRMNLNNIEIVIELDPELPMTIADYYQMQQVFANIITNAEQAMTEAHGGGKLVIKTHPMEEMIQVTFTDDGPGIPKDNLRKLFDPFFTTKVVGEGTGLGLSICYGIMQEHGGRIYKESKVSEGTTFVVEIPAVSEVCAVEETDSTHHLQSIPHYM